MFNLPSKTELRELQALKEPFCLSIYAPFIEPTTKTNPNRIELKNLLREARLALMSANVPPKIIKKTLAPAKELLKNHEFWPIHRTGLVLFMHPKLSRYYHVPDHGIPYQISLSPGFNLDPLLQIIRDDRPYYVLSVSHNHVKLYKGSHYAFKELHVKDLPSSLKESLRIDEYPHWSESHCVAPASYGRGSEAFHGQYNDKQVDKDMLYRFFRLIDKRLHDFLRGSRAPLVFAGVGYLFPIYKHVNTYHHLLPDAINGSPEHTRPDLMHKKSWSIVNRLTPVNNTGSRLQGRPA